MYSATHDSRAERSAGKDAFRCHEDKLRTVTQQQYTLSAPGAKYQQGGELGRNLRQQMARLIKARRRSRGRIRRSRWLGSSSETKPNQLSEYAAAVRRSRSAAFSTDLGDRMEDIVLVTMSEFGRTVEENGNAGTDHGHGNVMLVLGGSVVGGKIYGQWPGLEREQLNEERDLAVTTDFRAVLSELVGGQLGQSDLAHRVPRLSASWNPLGLLRS